jgi:hypothetical protein
MKNLDNPETGRAVGLGGKSLPFGSQLIPRMELLLLFQFKNYIY